MTCVYQEERSSTFARYSKDKWGYRRCESLRFYVAALRLSNERGGNVHRARQTDSLPPSSHFIRENDNRLTSARASPRSIRANINLMTRCGEKEKIMMASER